MDAKDIMDQKTQDDPGQTKKEFRLDTFEPGYLLTCDHHECLSLGELIVWVADNEDLHHLTLDLVLRVRTNPEIEDLEELPI